MGEGECIGLHLVLFVVLVVADSYQLHHEQLLEWLVGLELEGVRLFLDLRDVLVEFAEALADGGVELVLDGGVVAGRHAGRDDRPLIA